MGNLGCDFAAGLFVPGGAIKEARRQAVSALQAARRDSRAAAAAAHEEGGGSAQLLLETVTQQEGERRETTGAAPAAAASAGEEGDGCARQGAQAPLLRVLCRTKAQVDAVLAVPWVTEVVLDFLEVHGLKEACSAVTEAGRRLVVATPRVLKPGEERLLQFYLRLGADALLLRSAGALQQLLDLGGAGAPLEVSPQQGNIPLKVPDLEGDFSLNATNSLTASLLLRAGLRRLAPTHDCNAAQVEGIARSLGPRASQLELILHHHLPIFHTEHCVYARFLSDGNSYKDCGHPCEKNTLHLRDGAGADHLVLADQGCRNTVFNAQAQTGLPFLPSLVHAGLGTFRIELVDEPPVYVAPLLHAYRQAVAAAVEVAAMQRALRGDAGVPGQGVTERAEARVGKQRAQHAQQEWEAAQAEAWNVLRQVPDANGRVHGAGLGSLEVRAEKGSGSMKPTAATLKAGR